MMLILWHSIFFIANSKSFIVLLLSLSLSVSFPLTCSFGRLSDLRVCGFIGVDRIACVMICCSIAWRNSIIHRLHSSWDPSISILCRYVRFHHVYAMRCSSDIASWTSQSLSLFDVLYIRSALFTLTLIRFFLCVCVSLSLSLFISSQIYWYHIKCILMMIIIYIVCLFSFHLGTVHPWNTQRHSISERTRGFLKRNFNYQLKISYLIQL